MAGVWALMTDGVSEIAMKNRILIFKMHLRG
jgi:hypothetical protein